MSGILLPHGRCEIAPGLSRRDLLKVAAAGVAAATSSVFHVSAQSPPPATFGELALVNGRFVDGRGQVASSLTIADGRIASVGRAIPMAPGAATIDLGG